MLDGRRDIWSVERSFDLVKSEVYYLITVVGTGVAAETGDVLPRFLCTTRAGFRAWGLVAARLERRWWLLGPN